MPFNWCIYREISQPASEPKPSGDVSVGDNHIPRKCHSILQSCGIRIAPGSPLARGRFGRRKPQPELSVSSCDTPSPRFLGQWFPSLLGFLLEHAPAIKGLIRRALHHFVL